MLVLPHLCLGDQQQPTVMVSVAVRNKAHVLPYSLTLLDAQDYPKDRMALQFRCDHLQDRSSEVLQAWLKSRGHLYHAIDSNCDGNDEVLYEVDPAKPYLWPEGRFMQLMQLKQEALDSAREKWADYVVLLDADVLLTNPVALKSMVESSKDLTITAPMLHSLGLYSNFWAGMTEDYYYKRTEEYLPILDRKKLGCHKVPMVHTAIFINLKRPESANLKFLPDEDGTDEDVPFDDIISFALSTQKENVSMHVCNQIRFGHAMVPPGEQERLKDDMAGLDNILVDIAADFGPIVPSEIFDDYLAPSPTRDTLDVDKIYMINLARRPDRREKMDFCADRLGIDYQRVDAVDGKDMDLDYLRENGIEMLPDFIEPYHGRTLTYGEIGCFMSHYHIWEDIARAGSKVSKAIIFEDDIRFEPYFRQKLDQLHGEIDRLGLEWDLIYLGRKIMHNANEPWVDGSNMIAHVDYTYWTLAYIITSEGARKLLAEEPLTKMVPVDEYLPIMYDRHPNQTWKESFANRNLRAFSVYPLLVHPTHYTGEDGYISDTEDTSTIDAAKSRSEGISKEEL